MLPATRQLCLRAAQWTSRCSAGLHSLPLTPNAASCGKSTSLIRPPLSVCRWESTSDDKDTSTDEFFSKLGVKLPAMEPESISDGSAGTWLEAPQLVVENKKKELDYHSLPIVLVKLTKNNTRIVMTKADYTQITAYTAGCAGFKNAKRGTNVAGQACAEIIAKKVREKGFTFVRVVIRGMGAARVDALKGLEIGGLRIVSITDETVHTAGIRRAKKKRRI